MTSGSVFHDFPSLPYGDVHKLIAPADADFNSGGKRVILMRTHFLAVKPGVKWHNPCKMGFWCNA